MWLKNSAISLHLWPGELQTWGKKREGISRETHRGRRKVKKSLLPPADLSLAQ